MGGLILLIWAMSIFILLFVVGFLLFKNGPISGRKMAYLLGSVLILLFVLALGKRLRGEIDKKSHHVMPADVEILLRLH